MTDEHDVAYDAIKPDLDRLITLFSKKHHPAAVLTAIFNIITDQNQAGASVPATLEILQAKLATLKTPRAPSG
jgi:hypothetical protein